MHLLSRVISSERVRLLTGLLAIQRVALFEFLHNSDLNLAGVAVFGNGTDDFDSHPRIVLRVDSFNYLPESALAQKPDRTI